MKRIAAILATICLFSTFTARVSADEVYTPVRGIYILKRLKTSVSELVKRSYPEATSNAFQDAIHFEHATRLYVAEEIAKMPDGKKAPDVVVRGPMEGGVWCDIRFKNRGLEDRPAYQRAESAITREDFVEHIFYPEDEENHCHLVVTLRTPLEPTDKDKEFIEALRKHLEGFGAFIDRQTALPENIKLPGIPDGPNLRIRRQKKP